MKLWTYEACKEFCKDYKYKSEVKEANSTCYTTCLKNGWFDEFGIDDKYCTWENKGKCVDVAKSCKTKTEFIKNFYGAYMKAMKNGWMCDIDAIFGKNETNYEKSMPKDSNRTENATRKTKTIDKINDGFHYVAIDRNTNFETRDYLNKGGTLTTYVKKQYHVDVPSLYFRKKYKEENDKEWWEQWFDIVEVKDKDVKKCPYCDWVTVDIHNKSGAFEVHIKRKHGLTKMNYLKDFPQDKKYFSLVNLTLGRQMEIDCSKFVTCKICGKKLARIDGSHLVKHHMTLSEYKTRYSDSTISSELHNKLSHNDE